MHVSGLFVYPVKSLRGISLERSEVGLKGLKHDRHWMVIDEAGRFRTQRQLPQMTSISTAIEGGGLVLSAEGFGAIEVPEQPGGAPTEATVWGWTGPALLVDSEVDRWLSDALQMPCRLVTMSPEAHRDSKVGGGEIAFPDAMPVLVAGEASLAALNETLEQPIPMDRFRANVIVQGSEAYAEDTWSEMQIGNLEFGFGRHCGRCLVTTTDQRTGVRHPSEEPLRTLARDRKIDGAACFGAYYLPRSVGELRVGDSIEATLRLD